MKKFKLLLIKQFNHQNESSWKIDKKVNKFILLVKKIIFKQILRNFRLNLILCN